MMSSVETSSKNLSLSSLSVTNKPLENTYSSTPSCADSSNAAITSPTSESLFDRLERSRSIVESSPSAAVSELTQLLEIIQSPHVSLFSSNESIDDISTGSVPFLALEHYLALAYVNLPTTDATERQKNLLLSCHLWMEFLQRIERLECCSVESTMGQTRDEQRQVEDMVRLTEQFEQDLEGLSSSGGNTVLQMPPPVNRDTKIARHKKKAQHEAERRRLRSLQERRARMTGSLAESDELDGFDDDGLRRAVALEGVQLCKLEAMEEWMSVLRELPMIATMVQQQRQQQSQRGGSGVQWTQQQQQNKPFQVTHVTRDSHSGTLSIRKEEIRSNVFRPSWNQPTMTLEELGLRERDAAIERERRQKDAEERSKQQPRRYEQLVKDGNEDDANLVDASAELDRKWDDWKDENPRGSGNKRANVGDRNF